MLRAAARRFLLVLAGCAGLTALISLLVGTSLGASAERSVGVGLDLCGSFLLVAGFFVGNHGPARAKREAAPLVGERFMRWASPEEQEDALNTSGIFITLGLVLIVLGIAIDSRHRLV